MPAEPHREIDPRRVRRHFARAADDYDRHAVLQREVAERLCERLEYFALAPGRVLDLGCGPGATLSRLAAHYRQARVIGVDIAHAMLRRVPRPRRLFRRSPPLVCGDMHHLPFADGTMDLVFCSLALQWSPDPERVFAECRRVLAPDGLLIFSSLGPDTLRELRQALAARSEVPAVNTFIDMHDLGDAMIRAGLAAPVLDVEHLTLTYSNATAVMRDLKTIGARYAGDAAAPGLRGRGWLRAVTDAYEPFRRDGSLPATFEVVYGHAFRPAAGDRPQDGSTVRGGAVHVPVDAIRRR